MSNNSPFGEVSGLMVKASSNPGEQKVMLILQLETDNGLNHLLMKVDEGSVEQRITWNNYGNILFTARLRSGDYVNVRFGYVHNVDDGNTLSISIVMDFNPHGRITLPDQVLHLEKTAQNLFLSSCEHRYNIPLDIVDQTLYRKTPNDIFADLESLYGMPLRNEDGKQLDIVKTMKAPLFTARFRKPAPGMNMSMLGNGPLSLEDYSTFMEEKAKAAEREARFISEQLLPRWEYKFINSMKAIFQKQQRIRAILRHWHAVPPFIETNATNMIAKFITVVLYGKMSLRITESHIYLFDDEPSLGIPRQLLTTDELMFVQDMFVERNQLFSVIKYGHQKQYHMSSFRLNTLLERAICRRYIIHQYALDMTEYALKAQRPCHILTLNAAVGQCYIENKKDLFLIKLKAAMAYKRNIVDNIYCMSMFVQIAGSNPEYVLRDSSSGDSWRSSSLLPELPSTPYVLTLPKF